MKKITGWLLLKDLPRVKAGTSTPNVGVSGAYWGSNMFWDNDSLCASPDFFLPICDDEEVCPKCKGIVDSYYCSTCKGQRKISKAPAKPPWPPVEGQVVWFFDYGNIYSDVCVKFTRGTIKTTYNVLQIVECFATKEQAEEYLAWRKEKGLA